ncbi:Rab family GTPase [[Eubacterium] cellulosolvens]
MVAFKRFKKKICLLGDASVGKTSLIKRYVHNEFDDKYITTLGANVSKKDMQLNILRKAQEPLGVNLTLSIWDILGQKDESSMRTRPIYFNGTNGAIIVCDVTRKDTFNNITEWIQSIYKENPRIPIVILGNKIDLYRNAEVYYRDLERFARENNIPMFTTSAKSNTNVDKAFNKLTELMLLELT